MWSLFLDNVKSLGTAPLNKLETDIKGRSVTRVFRVVLIKVDEYEGVDEFLWVRHTPEWSRLDTEQS